MSALATLQAEGWERLEAHQHPENPLRVYLYVPLRDRNGCWFTVPVLSRPLPMDADELTALAETAAREMGRDL